MNSIERFQEYIRINDATLFKLDEKGTTNGTTGIKLCRCMIKMDAFRSILPKEYIKFVEDTLDSIKEDEVHMRYELKRILKYPNFGYDPWNDIEDNEFRQKQLQRLVCNETFRMKIVNDKLCVVPLNQNLRYDIHNICSKSIDTLPEPEVMPPHMIVVNSDVVKQVGMTKVLKFMEQNEMDHYVSAGTVSWTVSRDWSPFAECYVLRFTSDSIMEYIEKFNKEFNLTFIPSLHMTFASKSRSLW
mgnify:CR=1 FL=1